MGHLKLNAPQLGGIEKIDGLYLKSFLYRVALVGAGVCPGVSNSVARRGTNSCVISRFATLPCRNFVTWAGWA